MNALSRLLRRSEFNWLLFGLWFVLFFWPVSVLSDLRSRPYPAFVFFIASWAALILILFLQALAEKRGDPPGGLP